jgi:hypothetical protein
MRFASFTLWHRFWQRECHLVRLCPCVDCRSQGATNSDAFDATDGRVPRLHGPAEHNLAPLECFEPPEHSPSRSSLPNDGNTSD